MLPNIKVTTFALAVHPLGFQAESWDKRTKKLVSSRFHIQATGWPNKFWIEIPKSDLIRVQINLKIGPKMFSKWPKIGPNMI